MLIYILANDICTGFADSYMQSRATSELATHQSCQSQFNSLKSYIATLVSTIEDQNKKITELEQTLKRMGGWFPGTTVSAKMYPIGRKRHLVSLRDTVECFANKCKTTSFFDLAERVLGYKIDLTTNFLNHTPETKDFINDLCCKFFFKFNFSLV